MSFWTALEHDIVVVGKAALELAPIVGTIVSITNPVAGALITNEAGQIHTFIINAEKTYTDAKQGDLKKAEVMQNIADALQSVQIWTGKPITADMAKMGAYVDSVVASFNLLAEVKATIKAQ